MILRFVDYILLDRFDILHVINRNIDRGLDHFLDY